MFRIHVFVAAILLPLAFQSPMAAPVTQQQAEQAAETWLVEMGGLAGFSTDGTARTIGKVLPVTLEAGATFYQASLLPTGYLLISGDTILRPVKAFGTESNLDLRDLPENGLRALLVHETAMEAVIIAGAAATPLSKSVDPRSSRWTELLSGSQTRSIPLAPPTGSYMLTTTWNQNRHYNAFCPDDPLASAYYYGRAPVGCVATAGAQLLNYFEWPPYATGTLSYDDAWGSIQNSHNVVLWDTYDWSNMQSSYNPWGAEPQAAVDAVAELMYECGVAAEMDYEHSGSSSSSSDFTATFAQKGYYEAATYVANTGQTFIDQVRDSILDAAPVLVSIPGHAIVADGYVYNVDGDWFHINYGWGSSNDGWYQPDDVTGSPLTGGQLGFAPSPIPLFAASEVLPLNGGYARDLSWVYPSNQVADTTSIRLLELTSVSSNLTHGCDTFGGLDHVYSHSSLAWQIIAAGRTGNGLRVGDSTSLGWSTITIDAPLTITDSTLFSFWYHRLLYDDTIYVEISTDGGGNYTPLVSWNRIASTEPWKYYSNTLSAYQGQTVRIRFRYDYPSGSHYLGSNAGFFLDDISITGVNIDSATVVDTASAATSGTFNLTGLAVGTHTYALQADTTGGLQTMSPSLEIYAGTADTDGMPDYWELRYGLDPAANDGTGDEDSDGVNNHTECQAGTNPTDVNDFPCITQILCTPSNRTVNFPTVPDRTYTVLSASSMSTPTGSWTQVGTSLSGQGFARGITDSAAGSTRFYRLEIEHTP